MIFSGRAAVNPVSSREGARLFDHEALTGGH
jgi:hypothetical protein